MKHEFWEFYVLPPDQSSSFSNVKVAYRLKKTSKVSDGCRHGESGDS